MSFKFIAILYIFFLWCSRHVFFVSIAADKDSKYRQFLRHWSRHACLTSLILLWQNSDKQIIIGLFSSISHIHLDLNVSMDIIELGKKNNDIPYILVSHSFVVEKVPIMYAIRMVKLNSTMKVLTDEKSHPSLSTLYSALNFYFLHVWTQFLFLNALLKKKRKSAD